MNWLKKPIITATILFLITFLSYGQTLQMYFLIDDNALIYKLQHPEQTLGLWGSGLLGSGPYRYRVLQFVPFYPIFEVSPMPYFAVGLLLYYLTSVVIYVFTLVITKVKPIAFAASALFAAGYVGSETMFGITNSWETNRGIIMTLVTFLIYFKFLKTRKVLYYIFSVVLFFFSLESIYVRAHGLIFALVAFDLATSWRGFKVREFFKALIRLFPFLVIYYSIYLSNTGESASRLIQLIKTALKEGNLLLLTIPLQDIGNLFFPDRITSILDKLISRFTILPNEFSVGSISAAFALCIILIYIIFKSKEKYLTKILIFAFLFAISNFFLFYVREPEHTIWTTHRYFSYSFAGVVIFWAICFYLISIKGKRVLFNLFNVGLILLYLVFSIDSQYQFNKKRSFPAKDFFASFTSFVPEIPKGAVTYFDLANDNKVRGEFGSFFGGMFSEASNLAIYNPHLDYMKDFIFTYKFEDVTKMINEKSTSPDKVFTFYYGEEGLLDTSQRIRKLLLESNTINLNTSSFSSDTPFSVYAETFSTKTLFSEAGGKTTGENPRVMISMQEDTPSLVPSLITFSMSVNPLLPPLPYEGGERTFSVSSAEKSKIFSYLLSKMDFRKNAVATSASFWKEQEPRFALDGRLETSWRGHRGFWDNIDRGITNDIEYLSIDLGRELKVGQVRWISAQKPLIPTHYKILTSLNGKSWKVVKEVSSKAVLPEGTSVSDSFLPVEARFVKMEILKTYGNDGPELKEFEVVDERYKDLDQKLVEQVKGLPFGRIENTIDLSNALSFIKQSANLRFYYRSSADNKQDPVKYVDVPMNIDGKAHNYSVQLPATGISWTNFTLEGFSFPSEITVGQAKIIYTSIEN